MLQKSFPIKSFCFWLIKVSFMIVCSGFISLSVMILFLRFSAMIS